MAKTTPFDVRTCAPWKAPVPLPGLDTPYLKTDKTGTVVTRFLHGDFVDDVIFDREKCLVASINGTPAIWNGEDGIWVRGNEGFNYMTNHYHRNANKQNRMEVCLSVQQRLSIEGEDHHIDGNVIAFKNGYLHIDEFVAGRPDCLHEPYPEAYAVNLVDGVWDPDADDGGVVKAFLEKVSDGNQETMQNIMEAFGLAMYAKSAIKAQQSGVLYGGGSNGKSVFTQFMTYALGERNVAAVKMKQLNKRELETVMDKLCCFDPDASSSMLDNEEAGTFRQVIAGDPVTIDPKYQNPYTIKNEGLAYFLNINKQLRVRGDDAHHGTMRRLFYIPFQHTFAETDEDYDPDILDKLCRPECASVMYKLALMGLKKVMENGFKYSPSAFNDESKEEFQADNDSVICWVREFAVAREVFTLEQGMPYMLQVENMKGSQGWCDWQNKYMGTGNKRPYISPYEHYRLWTAEEGRMSVSQRAFNKRVGEVFNIKPLRNKRWSTWNSTPEKAVRYPVFGVVGQDGDVEDVSGSWV